MKLLLSFLLCVLPTFAQSNTKWVRGGYTDKMTGRVVATYQLYAEPDGSSQRRPYLGITCDQVGRRYTYGYFTDAMVYVDAQYANARNGYYPTRLQYRGDAPEPKTAYVTVRSDFETIDIDQKILQVAVTAHTMVLSFPSQSGYTVTDTFATDGFPGEQFAADCFTERQRRKR